MIRRGAGLAQRLSVALVGIAFASVAVLASGVWISHQWIEETVLNRSLEHELEFLIERGVAPQDLNLHGSSVQLFRPAQSAQWRTPAELLALDVGAHHDVRIGDNSFHVLVKDLAPGDRAYLVYDIEVLERREDLILLTLAIGMLLTLLLAVLVSRRVALASLRPFEALVRRIAALDPERRGQRIGAAEQYPDLHAIVGVLNAHLAALDAVVERERAFGAAANHELRTPLTVIATAAELHQHNPELAADACTKIRRAVDTATNLLDALLALSQARDLPERAAVALDRALPELAEPYQDTLRRRQTSLRWVLAPEVRWQGSLAVAAVVFTNLLRNAMAVSPQQAIEVELSATELAVRDRGPGLDAAVAERAFEPGVSGSGGSGMGLYIARTLARRYGGDIRLESPPDGGIRAVWRFA